jgi:hypothetical protein
VISGFLLAGFGSYKAIVWTWKNQIDPVTTFKQLKESEPQIASLIASRDPQKIYQKGKSVGNITGEVVFSDDQIIFAEITDSSELDRGQPIEYQRYKLRIIKIESAIGLYIGASTSGSETKSGVLKNVVCEKGQ